MDKPTCAFDNCNRSVEAKNLCSTHYEQQRNGKPLTPIGLRIPQPAECAFAGCNRKPYSKGLCSGHHAQQKSGKPLTPIGSRRRGRASSRDDSLCVVLSCSSALDDDLFCAEHWDQLKPELGDARPGACRVLDCDSALHSHGFCKVHWGRITRYGRTVRVNEVNDDEEPCKVEFGGRRCPEPVHAKGYCFTHYMRVRRTGEPGPVELIPQSERQIGNFEGILCMAELGGERCQRQAESLGWCTMHYQRWRRTGDPIGPWGIKPRKSDGYLTSDGYFMAKVGGRRILEHRLVMEQIIGRPLHSFEEPHHKNGIRDDNTPDNLELWTSWRQPNGQRVEDLLAFIAEYYPQEMMALLVATQSLGPDITKPGPVSGQTAGA